MTAGGIAGELVSAGAVPTPTSSRSLPSHGREER